MNDLDLIDRKKDSFTGEAMAEIAIGSQNLFLGNNSYLPRNKQSKYLDDLELNEFEKELGNMDKYINEDLKDLNYESRLKYSLENSFVDVDLTCENITQKANIWDGYRRNKVSLYDKYKDTNFSLYDIYITIEKTDGEFTKKDIINLMNLNILIEIGGSNVFEKNFLSILLFELLEEQEILIQPNIIYLKAFTFQNLKYGLPQFYLKYHEIRISIKEYDSKHSNYIIDVILSGKNLYSLDIIEKKIGTNEEYNFKDLELILALSQSEKYEKKISSGEKTKIYFNYSTSILIYCLYSDSDDLENNLQDLDNLTNPVVEAICVEMNGHKLWWENDELIKINFMGITLNIVCIDPKFRNYNRFNSFINNDFDPKTLQSINFCRIDKSYSIIEYSNDKKYNLFLTGININVLRMTHGMAGLVYSS